MMRGSCVLLALIGLAHAFVCTGAEWTPATRAPFWPMYPERTFYVLDGEWNFGYAGDVDPLTVTPDSAPTPETVIVPNAFDVAPPGILGRRGTAFYRTTITVDKSKPLMLYFTACSFYCRVFLDDTELGEHRAGGYQPFWLHADAASHGTADGSAKRTLLVIVNNQFNATLAPTHTGGDFWMYGGITRSVIVHEQPANTYIRQVETFTVALPDTHGDGAKVDVRVVLKGVQTSHATFGLTFDDHGVTQEITAPVNSDGACVLSSIPVKAAKAWSLTEPNLHQLRVTLMDGDVSLDTVEVRFGLRIVSTTYGATHAASSQTRVLLNGAQVKLHGFNRHTMRPDTGSALNLTQVQEDVKQLVEVNANYVRGAHYPQDPRFLDLCDEHGIAIWEETLGPGVTLQDLESSYFLHYQVEAVNEMIDASINHPCILWHGFYNEGPSDQSAACPGYNVSASAIRARTSVTPGAAPSRLVTWASNHKTSDVCLDIADVISFNSYPAWYDHPGEVNQTAIFWASQVAWIQENFPHKPFTISETGAGGVYEWVNTSGDPRWSQEYQDEVVMGDAQFALKSDAISGLTVWQFNDIKANDGDTAKCGQCTYMPHPPSLSVPWDCAYIDVSCNRPGGENHKGATDFWRRPKIDFFKVAALYGEVGNQ